MGMELVGACSPEMCEWLHCLAQWHRRRADTVLQGRPSAYIFYTNLYAHGQIHDLEPGSPEEQQALQALIADALALAYGAEESRRRTVLTAGFLEGPIGCHPQSWHYDYMGNTENIFIPLVPLTERNGTEYVDFGTLEKSAANRTAVLHYILQLYEETEELTTLPPLPVQDPYVIRRLIAEPFQVVRMHYHALHHGVKNEETYVRRVFFIASTNQPGYRLAEHHLTPLIFDYEEA